MSLAAEQVADAIASRIGANAYTAHPEPFAESELPAFRVVIAAEATEEASLDRICQHNAEIKVRGYAKASAALDEALNALAVTALPLIFASPVPYGLQPDGDVTREMQEEGAASVGCIEIPVRAIFFTRPTAPETILS